MKIGRLIGIITTLQQNWNLKITCDTERGDNPVGARIEQCKQWYKESKGTE